MVRVGTFTVYQYKYVVNIIKMAVVKIDYRKISGNHVQCLWQCGVR